MGGPGCLARGLADLPRRAERRGPGRGGGGRRRRVVGPGENGAAAVGKTTTGQGTKAMGVVEGEGLPLACHRDSASRAEVQLLEATLDPINVTEDAGAPARPERLILDRGYDSDPLRERRAARGREMIGPHPKNRRRPTTPEGRKLRRYRRRW